MAFINRAKTTGIILITIGTSWAIAKIKDTRERLNHTLDLRIIKHLEPNSAIAQQEEQNVVEKTLPIQLTSAVYNRTDEGFAQRFWRFMKFHYAKRLLDLAQCDMLSIRLKAVKHLSKIKNLEAWQYAVLAQDCDTRTAIGLARSPNVDSHWFHNLPIRYANNDISSLQIKTKEFLMMLSQRSQHKCLSYFISKVFFDGHDSKFSDKSLEPSELVRHIKSHSEILPLCVESILHHSSITNYAKDILTLNGLLLLHEIYLKFSEDDDMCKHFAQILLNVSIYENSLEEFDRAGWIKILSQWCNSSDFNLSTTAACTLANLDVDEKCPGKFFRQLYLLHPLKRNEIKSDVDVILVHGLLGGVFHTWRQRDRKFIPNNGSNKDVKSLTIEGNDEKNNIINCEDNVNNFINTDSADKNFEFVLHDIPVGEFSSQCTDLLLTCKSNDKIVKQANVDGEKYTKCWPRDWLVEDCDDINIRLLGINFSTSLSMWAPICPEEHVKRNLVERSSELLSKLVEAGVGNRPIIWVTHSMGGLLVKRMLINARDSDNELERNVVTNSKGIVFFSTPHRGSALAALRPATALVLWPSAELVEMRHNSALLLEIHDKFMNLLNDFPIKVLSFIETKSTLIKPLRMNMHFVQEHSADLGFGETYLIPLDHLNICKPINRQSFLYQKIVQLLKDIADEQKQ